jgi:hypothetical protein
MLLGIAQKNALALLAQYGCLREDQIERLLSPSVPRVDMDAIKRQLSYFDLIDSANGFIFLPGRYPEPALLGAVDVMLCFPREDIQLHKPAPEPFLLTFFKNGTDGKLRRYDVCRCEPGRELILSALLEGLPDKYRTVLVMLESLEQRRELHILCDHCFVLREGAEYKFYKPAQDRPWRDSE